VADKFSIDTPRDAAVTAFEYPAEGKPLGATLILAHGAGAPQSHPWIVKAARGLAKRGVAVVTFNFLYMEQRKKAPDRTELLEGTYIAAVKAVRARSSLSANRLFIGGKSMGGRMALHIASKWSEAEGGPGGALEGLIFFGYPLHPPGKPEQQRSAHLPSIRARMLFIQGTRDAFGTPEELRPILDSLPAKTTLSVVEGGDHSFNVPKSGPLKQADVDDAILDAAVEFIGK
jgi:predicted alpha/beta-hydrolase family hydrolase